MSQLSVIILVEAKVVHTSRLEASIGSVERDRIISSLYSRNPCGRGGMGGEEAGAMGRLSW